MAPIHPAVVHIPIALVLFSALAELLGAWFRNAGLRAAAFWSLAAAAMGALAAVWTGYYDMGRAELGPEADGIVHLHLRIGLVLLFAITALALWRWRIFARAPEGRPGALYPIAAALVVALTAFQGWYGGEMVYAYGISVAPTGQGTEAASEAKRRLARARELLGAPHAGAGHGD